MEERAAALKEQEGQIAAMLSGLQIEKAKEVSSGENLILKIKMNVMAIVTSGNYNH